MTYRGPWNAAGMRHRQTPRAYKTCKPVGDDSKNRVGGMAAGSYEVLRNGERRAEVYDGRELQQCEPEVCPGCRYHVCSCQQLRAAQWLGKKAKAAEVQADMQPEASPCKVCGSTKPVTTQRYCSMCLLAGEHMKVGHFVTVDTQPLSPAYLDGIDEALERAGGSASSGLTGIDEGKYPTKKLSTCEIAKTGHVSAKTAPPDEVTLGGKPLLVGHALWGWSGSRDGSRLYHIVTQVGRHTRGPYVGQLGFTTFSGGYETQWLQSDANSGFFHIAADLAGEPEPTP